jgi:two-component system phosphate regulon sensor histidine kinase PhoR
VKKRAFFSKPANYSGFLMKKCLIRSYACSALIRAINGQLFIIHYNYQEVSKMKRIILAASCLLSAFSIVLTAVLVHISVYWGFTQRMKEEAAAELELIRAGIEVAGYGYLDRLDSGIAGQDLRITVVRANGTVLFDNEYEAAAMENHAGRPEVAAAIVGKIGEQMRYSDTRRTQAYYRARLLDDGNVLRVAVSMDNIISSALAQVPLTLAIAPVIFICAVVIASRITRRIVKPINEINLEAPEESVVYDELSPLLLRVRLQNDQIAAQMAELRKKQLEFEAITDNMREGLLVLDREGRILSCNGSARRLLHTHAAIAERQNVLTLRRDEPFRDALEKAQRGIPAECRLSSKSSHLRLIASPVADGGTVLLLLDVTEQEDREKLRREFSANVSHELKTPLTVISGYAELLSEGLVRPEDTAEFGGKMFHEARRLLNLINDIMQLSRLDEGAAGLEREPVSLRALVKGVVERVSPVARARNVRIAIDTEPETSINGEGERDDKDAVITGIPQVLHEMVFNLVDNGIKYNRESGCVTVSIRREGSAVCLAVADTGIGIPEAEQERVFERFYRVDKSRNSETGGTGLGLSIVKHGAQLHGATIELASGTTGTTVRLMFQSPQGPFGMEPKCARRNMNTRRCPPSGECERMIAASGY